MDESLDEIKRIELQRLKDLTEQKRKLEKEVESNGINGNSIDIHHHLDQNNPHTFEIEDLKKLIAKTTQDLAEADKRRKEEFKRYEMEKEYEKQEKLNHTNGAEKEKLQKEYEELEAKHKKHEKLHEPGHKQQLEEVWEEQDQMQQDFDPKTFFMLHDIDGNGLWDQDEVKALFIKELDKMYQQGAPEDDMRERVEEMERMRERVFTEMDYNRDGFIDYREFQQQTYTDNFKQDHGWQGLDEQTKPYSEEELAEYIRQHHAANQIPQYDYMPHQQVHPGYQQPQGGYQQPQGGYQQHQGGYQQIPQGYQQVQQNQQFHAGQVPPQHSDLNTNEVYQNQQPPPQQFQQVPQQQYNQPGQGNPQNVPLNQNQQQFQHVPQQQFNQPGQAIPQNIPVNHNQQQFQQVQHQQLNQPGQANQQQVNNAQNYQANVPSAQIQYQRTNFGNQQFQQQHQDVANQQQPGVGVNQQVNAQQISNNNQPSSNLNQQHNIGNVQSQQKVNNMPPPQVNQV
ncbi:nucleobindin-1 isoform X2 [Sitophilus oryzae]|uniref:Nucleobindin-1 isoform X2 n=1 Tax=Sitophilus oryzae TaxID=7048 RepID=A0A6J2XNC0_SITOR|nr:nucleobindin-1 isoform X2 [Sitophilus oryzae]